ncbi:MAG: PAS domain S-box protein [Paludibacter sp.]
MRNTFNNKKFFHTLRGRLIISVAVVHAVMMSLFIVDLTSRQKKMLLDRQTEMALSLSQSLSISAGAWLVSDNVAGIQELVNSQRVNPEIIFSMIADENGRIMAHTDRTKIGKYLLDIDSKTRKNIISRAPDLVDIAVPVFFESKHVGWARIGLGQQLAQKKLSEIVFNGALYALGAIIFGSFIAWWFGRRLTKSLYAIQNTMNNVAAGNYTARSPLKGNDEAVYLAKEFNDMLDALAEREMKLKTNEIRFGKLFNLASVPLCIVNKEGDKMTYNERFLHTFGYDSDEVPTVNEWLKLVYPDLEYRKLQTEIWGSAVEKALTTNNEIDNIESNVQIKNSEVRTLILSGVIVNDEIIITYYDITEQKKSESLLLQNLKFTETLLMSIPIPVFIKDIEGRYVNCNQAFTNHTGYTAEYIKGKTAFDLWPSYQAELFHKKDLEILENRQYLTFEANIEDKDKNIRDAIYFKNLYYEENGNMAGIIGTFIDITQRLKAEEELRISELRYSSLFKNIETGIVVHGPDTEVLMSNPKASELLGLSTEQMKGKVAIDPDWKFINENNEVLALKDYPVNRVVREKTVLKSQILGICQPKTSDIVWVSVNGFTISNEMGEITEIIISFNDITEIKKYEKKLYKLNHASEQHIIERTLELEIATKKLEFENAEKEKRAVELIIANKELAFQNEEKEKRAAELVIANKELSFQNEEKVRRATELISANKDLESFSYSVSHDLRAPLRHIIGFSDLLSKVVENKLSEDGLHYLNVINDSAKKMGDLIDDLLNFSRTSRAELRKVPIDMNTIIDNAKNQMQYSSNRKIKWKISKCPIVMGDYNLLLMVWVNLLNNALKYSSKREETAIIIDFIETETETIFSVSDNGVGFDMKYVSKLFGIFQRLHTTAEFEGTGIGLANVQRIIAKHGGRTWAESEINKGATFYFSLPKTN